MNAVAERAWDPGTDDVLATHREVGMEVHRPTQLNSLTPRCHATGTFFRYGAWVVRLEIGHACKKCFPGGLPR